MENVVSTLHIFPWENVSFAELKWITGKTNIVWGWLVWKQGRGAWWPDHNVLLWKNQELRQSSYLGRAAGAPIGSMSLLRVSKAMCNISAWNWEICDLQRICHPPKRNELLPGHGLSWALASMDQGLVCVASRNFNVCQFVEFPRWIIKGGWEKMERLWLSSKWRPDSIKSPFGFHAAEACANPDKLIFSVAFVDSCGRKLNRFLYFF